MGGEGEVVAFDEVQASGSWDNNDATVVELVDKQVVVVVLEEETAEVVAVVMEAETVVVIVVVVGVVFAGWTAWGAGFGEVAATVFIVTRVIGGEFPAAMEVFRRLLRACWRSACLPAAPW